jgi:hypothetical protein
MTKLELVSPGRVEEPYYAHAVVPFGIGVAVALLRSGQSPFGWQ